jgi:glyoxylase-like metal-dependent hydrolase (beta-lactamase superfamily II)
MQELADGLWRWIAPHPEWHPPGFEQVACYALRDDAGLVLVDPLLAGPDEAAQWQALDGLVDGSVRVVVTVPYHVRSAEDVWARYRDRHEVTVHGHPLCAKRLRDRSAFRALAPGEVLPGGVVAHPIGRPRRSEQPLELQSHRALAFGDAVLEVGGELRVWEEPPEGERRRRWYEDRYLPTLRALTELEVERVLVTHGEPVLDGGAEALARGLGRPPWTRRSG